MPRKTNTERHPPYGRRKVKSALNVHHGSQSQPTSARGQLLQPQVVSYELPQTQDPSSSLSITVGSCSPRWLIKLKNSIKSFNRKLNQ